MVLRNADTRVTVDATHGGALREFTWRGLPILRPAQSDSDTDPMSLACFPLVPYANRVAGGHFSFDHHDVHLNRNWDRDPYPLHGQGWRAAWTVQESGPAQATLTFDGGGDEWPWAYRAIQEFVVRPDGLDVRLAIYNRSQEAMPAMLGLHPYFPQAAQASIQARARTLWLTDAQALPVQETLVPLEWSFDAGRPARSVALDHCLDHWDGGATVRWPDRVLKMTATHAAALHVFTPKGMEFFCLEPQTAAAGALNRQSPDVARLAPGQSLEMQVRFSVESA